MPKIVDRDERRTEILTCHIGLVRRVGLDKASSRALAAEADIATGALWNYFDSMDELVLESYRLSFAELNNRIRAINDEYRGLTAFVKVVGELLPFSSKTVEEAQVTLDYLYASNKYPGLNEVQRDIEGWWISVFQHHLAQAQEDGDLAKAASPEEIGELALVLVVGLQMESILPGARTAEPTRQWHLFESAITPWLRPGVKLPPQEQLRDGQSTSNHH